MGQATHSNLNDQPITTSAMLCTTLEKELLIIDAVQDEVRFLACRVRGGRRGARLILKHGTIPNLATNVHVISNMLRAALLSLFPICSHSIACDGKGGSINISVCYSFVLVRAYIRCTRGNAVALLPTRRLS